jgi:peptide/nickel transport system ATP-binding protein
MSAAVPDKILAGGQYAVLAEDRAAGGSPGEVTQIDRPVLRVQDLQVSFIQYTAGLRQQGLQVINGLDVDVYPKEILAVVGASGSGKSLLAHAILGILPVNARVKGTIRYQGEVLAEKRQANLRGRKIALIPQSVNFLDPLMRVGQQVRTAVKEGQASERQRQVFERFRLEKRVERLYPFQLSGGMARRILVAIALVSGADLIIADEPTPGLDPAVLKEALGHFRELADEGRAVMLITHDIDTALQIADRIAVFYAGSTLEVASVKDFSGTGERLRHPYSQALWRALPRNGFLPVPGFQPPPHDLPSGCLFEPRCPMATAECRESRPQPRRLRGGMVRCIHAS